MHNLYFFQACAAASRQKKKEYIDTLERRLGETRSNQRLYFYWFSFPRVQTCTEENQHLQKKVDSLQCQNR